MKVLPPPLPPLRRARPTDTGKAIGGWDPTWDIFKVPAPRPLMPPKLHKNQRHRAKRAEKVSTENNPRYRRGAASVSFMYDEISREML